MVRETIREGITYFDFQLLDNNFDVFVNKSPFLMFPLIHHVPNNVWILPLIFDTIVFKYSSLFIASSIILFN